MACSSIPVVIANTIILAQLGGVPQLAGQAAEESHPTNIQDHNGGGARNPNKQNPRISK
jgi:hypothetical protein